MESLAAKHFPSSGLGRADSGLEGSTRSIWPRLGLAVIAAALLALAHHASRELAAAPRVAAAEEEPVYLPDVRFLRLAALGYDNALADVLWFRTIDYFGKHFRGNRIYPWLARMCDVVTDLDPRAQHVYSFAGFILPWEAQRPDDGIRMLEKGIAQFPDSWQLHYYLGFSYFFFKNDPTAALPHLRRAAELPGAHPYVTRLAAMLYSQQYGTATAREFLEDLRDNGGASGMQAVIGERLKDVELSEHVNLLEKAVETYRQRFGRDPEALEELVASGVLAALPSEPFGFGYTYDAAQRQVRSTSGRRALRAYDSARRRQVLSGETYRD
jgi:hypothetical protein